MNSQCAVEVHLNLVAAGESLPLAGASRSRGPHIAIRLRCKSRFSRFGVYGRGGELLRVVRVEERDQSEGAALASVAF